MRASPQGRRKPGRSRPQSAKSQESGPGRAQREPAPTSAGSPPEPRSRDPRSTRDVLLDTAEHLFAEKGVDAVSLREINVAAGFSVATLHYHFSTREAVVRALLERSRPPMFAERARMLATLAGLESPSIEAIVATLVRPMASVLFPSVQRGARMLRFLARLYLEEAPQVSGEPQDSLPLYLPLLRRALPNVQEAALTQRWLHAGDLALHSLANIDRLYSLAIERDAGGNPAVERFIERLEQFLAGGLGLPEAL